MSGAGGTPGSRDDPRARDVLAAEYVLGTLEAHEAQAVAAALGADRDLARLVEAWEARLAPLSALAPRASPPPELWGRIERSLDAVAPRPPSAMPGPSRAAPPSPAPPLPPEVPARPPRWAVAWAAGATLLAAGLAGLLLFRPPAAPGPRLSTALLPTANQPAWVVEADRDGLRLASLNTREPEGDRVLQLWALPQGASAPVSLGLVPAVGLVSASWSGLTPAAGMLIEITLEPPGGSPTGRPTGPVQFIGRLRPAVGS